MLQVYVRKGCVTCKRALDYLEAKRVEFEVIDFFKQPLSKNEIRGLLKRAGVSPREAIRKKDKMFKQLGLDTRVGSDDELLSLMERSPGLVLRPIVVSGNRAIIATKPDMLGGLVEATPR
jgi:arsenate reductase